MRCNDFFCILFGMAYEELLKRLSIVFKNLLQILFIYPIEPRYIKHRPSFLYALNPEVPYKCFHVEYLFVTFWMPSKKRNKINKRLFQISHFSILGDRHGTMAFRKLASIGG